MQKRLGVRGCGRLLFAALALSAVTAAHAQSGGANTQARGARATDGQWVTTWATAQQLAPTRVAFGGRDQPPPLPAQARIPGTVRDQTIRMIARTSLGGGRVRIRLSNALDKAPLRLGAAHVAVRTAGSGIVPASDRALTFGGQTGTIVWPGTAVVSDPVDLAVPALADLAVSLFLPDDTGPPTVHPDGLHTAYLMPGDATARDAIDPVATTTAYLWLSAIDVFVPATAGTVVTFGDSITDGVGTTLDANRGWASLLAATLASGQARTPPMAVANTGLSGNRLLRSGFGVNALARFDRDVLSLSGVRWMTVLLGINDITFPAVPGVPATESVTAGDLIGGLTQLVTRAHAHGIKVAGATITPVEGVGTYTERGEDIREAVNRWIRTSGTFDAVVDFDAVVRDPANPKRLRAAFDPGDHVHPNDAGNAAMAAAIDASMFRR